MLDIRKFPLLVAVIPYIAGMLLEFCNQWQLPFCSLLLLLTLVCFFVCRKFFELGPGIRHGFLSMAFLSLGMIVFCLKDYRFYRHSIAGKLNSEQVITGEILEKKAGTGGKQQLLLDVQEIRENKIVTEKTGKVVVDVSDDSQIFHVGEIVVVNGELTAFENRNNPGEFDAVYFYRSRKVSAHVFASGETVMKIGESHSMNRYFTEWRNYLSEMMERELDGEFLAISKALILGDKSGLDNELMSSFSATGAMHVLAVSGLHIGLILVLFRRVLDLFSRWITRRQGILIAIVLIWIYGGLTGASPSVMRAVVMFSILSAGQLLRRQNHPINVLALSALVLLSYDPWMLFDLGFQLSYAAMLGIFLLYRPIVDAWAPSQKLLRMTWEGTAVGLAATIVTMPLTLFWFYQFPNYFALANLGVMVFGFGVLMLGLVFLFTSWVPFLVKLVALLFSFSIVGLVYWIAWVDELPGAVSGGFHLQSWEMAAAYMLIFAWIFHLNKRLLNRWILSGLTLALICFWSVNRSEVLNANRFIVFNSNQFTAVLKTGHKMIAFYDQKWNGSWKVPRELESYAKYAGCSLQIIPMEEEETVVRKQHVALKLKKVKEGIAIRFNGEEWLYRTSGTPGKKENRRLLTTKLQLHLDPRAPTKPFVYAF